MKHRHPAGHSWWKNCCKVNNKAPGAGPGFPISASQQGVYIQQFVQNRIFYLDALGVGGSLPPYTG